MEEILKIRLFIQYIWQRLLKQVQDIELLEIAEKCSRSPAKAEKKFKNIRTAYHFLKRICQRICQFEERERENNKLQVGVFDSQPLFWKKVQRLFHAERSR